jgi:hypothetical protein
VESNAHAATEGGTSLAFLRGMRLLTAAGVAVFWAGTAFGGYLVELDGGDRMTVDSYWEEGGRTHLMRGGVDMSVPSGRVRSIKAASEAGDDSAGIGRTQPSPAEAPRRAKEAPSSSDTSRRTLKGQLVRIERHQVRVSKELSIAQSRGESPKNLKRLQRELDHTWERRQDVKQTLGEAE